MSRLAQHPRGLSWLTFIVGTERFAANLLLSLLVFYLNERQGLSVGRSSALLGYFLALSYLSTLIGGYVADRWLGAWRASMLGAVCLGLGYAVLACEHGSAFFLALVVVALGTGFFKPNAQVLLDGLYQFDGPERDEGYSLYYTAANVGSLFAPLAAATLKWWVGWSGAFAIASASMLGCVVALQLSRNLFAHTPPAKPSHQMPPPRPDVDVPFSRMVRLCLAATVFFAALSQSAGTLLFWARDCTDRRMLGWELPASTFAAMPAALVLILSPQLVHLWRVFRLRGCVPSMLGKIRIGFLTLAAAYAVLAAAATSRGTGGQANMLWLLPSFVLMATAELCAAPLGPALLVRWASPQKRGLMMAVWFANVAFGNILGSFVGGLWSLMPPSWIFSGICMVLVGTTRAILWSTRSPDAPS